MTTTAWKVLDGVSATIGTGDWHRPHGKRPGKWLPPIADLVPCESGYHVCDTTLDLLAHLGPDIWVCEWRGDSISDTDKRVVEQARLIRHIDGWTQRTARLFAADCAADVLPVWDARHPDDDRPRLAVEAARQFAEGEIGREELVAARAAAEAAAEAAAGAAAWVAAWVAAEAAAWAAARAAAGAMPRCDVVGRWHRWHPAAAWVAARDRQADRLTQIIGTLPEEP